MAHLGHSPFDTNPSSPSEEVGTYDLRSNRPFSEGSHYSNEPHGAGEGAGMLNYSDLAAQSSGEVGGYGTPVIAGYEGPIDASESPISSPSVGPFAGAAAAHPRLSTSSSGRGLPESRSVTDPSRYAALGYEAKARQAERGSKRWSEKLPFAGAGAGAAGAAAGGYSGERNVQGRSGNGKKKWIIGGVIALVVVAVAVGAGVGVSQSNKSSKSAVASAADSSSSSSSSSDPSSANMGSLSTDANGVVLSLSVSSDSWYTQTFTSTLATDATAAIATSTDPASASALTATPAAVTSAAVAAGVYTTTDPYGDPYTVSNGASINTDQYGNVYTDTSPGAVITTVDSDGNTITTEAAAYSASVAAAATAAAGGTDGGDGTDDGTDDGNGGGFGGNGRFRMRRNRKFGADEPGPSSLA